MPGPHNYPETGGIADRFATLERRLSILERAARLTSASIGAGGLRVHDDGQIRSSDFDGDLTVQDPGTQGWALGADAAAFGTLYLRDQIVGPDSLGITWDGRGASVLNFDVDPTVGNQVSVSVPVPSWATEALVFVWVNASIKNGSGGFDYGYVRALIDGLGGGEQFSGFDAGEWTNITATARRTVSGASLGTTIELAGRVRSQSNDWGPQSGNIMNLDSQVFFRKV